MIQFRPGDAHWMSRLLFVVHRYAPYPGGSEYNVQRLAEEALSRGHGVTVLADTHLGDYRGVRVTSDRRIMREPFDLIIVHGDLAPQRVVLAKAHRLLSPVLFLLVEPKTRDHVLQGMHHATFLGWGTSFDLEHIRRFGHSLKAMRCRYGVPASAEGRPGFKATFGIPTSRMYLSTGGFWPRKGMEELTRAFLESRPPDTTLVLMGYDPRRGVPDGAPGVRVVVFPEHQGGESDLAARMPRQAKRQILDGTPQSHLAVVVAEPRNVQNDLHPGCASRPHVFAPCVTTVGGFAGR